MADSPPPSSSSQNQVRTVSFGLWWPSGDPDKLRQAASAWSTIANHLDTATTTLSGAVGAVTTANSGTAVYAFAGHWQATGGPRGAMPSISGYCREIAKSLGDFADEIDKARRQIMELAAEIAASVAIGTLGAIFTAGLSEAAAAATTAGIVDAAASIGVTLGEQAAALIGRVVAMGVIGSAESMATNTIVQLDGNAIFNQNHDPFSGFNWDEVASAGEFGFAAGELVGGIQSLRGLSGLKASAEKTAVQLDQAFKYANSEPKLEHVFGKAQHGLDQLVKSAGGRSEAMREIVNSFIDRTGLPTAGKFEVTRLVGGFRVTIRGAVVDGVPKIGTVFIAP